MPVSFVRPAALLVCGLILLGAAPIRQLTEEGVFSVYFRDEKVGYEEYTWQEDERGFSLSIQGRLTKPVPMVIADMTIRLDSGFIPEYFHFKGEVSGVAQEIISEISEGRVESVIRVAGQEQTLNANVRRDAILLPNPVFSSYMVITKKYRCDLREAAELAAYIIPQTETTFTLEPDPDSECRLILQMGATRIDLETDASGVLRQLIIPSQDLRVERDSPPSD